MLHNTKKHVLYIQASSERQAWMQIQWMMPKTSKTAKTDHDDDDEDDDDDDDDDGSDGDVRNIIASVTAHSIIYVQDRLLTAKPRKSRYNSLGFVSIASPLTNSVLT